MKTTRAKNNKETYTNSTTFVSFPFLRTIDQMAKLCGIGENTLRRLVEEGEIEYLQNGNRKLLRDEAIMDYYHRHKTPAK